MAASNGAMVEGDTWYLLSMRWWGLWSAFVKYDEKAAPDASAMDPGPIDATDLLDGEGALRRNLSASEEVQLVPEPAWRLLLQHVGAMPGNGGVALPRQVIRVGAAAADTRIENASVSQAIVLGQMLAWARGCSHGEDAKFSWGWRVLASLPDHDRPAMRELTRIHFGW